MEYENSEDITSIKIFVNPDLRATQIELIKDLLRLDLKINIRETCYGLLISGRSSEIQRAISHLRVAYPFDVFIKETAPNIRGSHIFRGFLQAASEYPLLSMISQALRSTQANNEDDIAEDSVWEAPPFDAGIYYSKMHRCRHIPHRRISILLMYRMNGDIIVRCPNAHKYCIWGNCTSCPYGLLEHNLDKWYQRAPTYLILSKGSRALMKRGL